MKIQSTETRLSPRNDYDIVIVSNGYETRSRFFSEQFKFSANSKIAFCFEEHNDKCARTQNTSFYNHSNFLQIELSGNDLAKAGNILREKIEANPSQKVSILIDISCMTRAWLSSLLFTLFSAKFDKIIEVDFFYVAAIFSEAPAEYPPNEIAEPLEGFAGFSSPHLPTLLLLGLGQDPDRAIGLKEYLDPEEFVLFYPFPGISSDYDSDIFENNQAILSDAKNNCFNYSLESPEEAFKSLESVILGCSDKNSIVLCSLGPKIFSLFCLLVAGQYPQVSIWRVTAGKHEEPRDRKPATNNSVVYRVTFV